MSLTKDFEKFERREDGKVFYFQRKVLLLLEHAKALEHAIETNGTFPEGYGEPGFCKRCVDNTDIHGGVCCRLKRHQEGLGDFPEPTEEERLFLESVEKERAIIEQNATHS